jgi:hypothetical protein
MKKFLEFNTPYNLFIASEMVTSIKQHGSNVLITTSDGGVHKINEKDYTLADVVQMYTPTTQSASTSTASKRSGAKKVLDKSSKLA